MTASIPNPLLELRKLGQSPWLDDISRGMLDDGSLARLIRDDGIAGLTSNPSIFANAMMKDPKYAQPIAQLLPKVSSAMALYEELALDDLKDAAGLLRAAVRLELRRRRLCQHGGVAASRRRQRREPRRGAAAVGTAGLPNAFIKIPGTEAGVPVIRDLIAAGINVNVTLLFAPERYRSRGPGVHGGPGASRRRRPAAARVASVASFFLSRIDSAVDKQLDALAARGQPAARTLRGKAAIASACRAYEIYEETARRAIAGRRSWRAARARNGCCGRPPPPRTRATVRSSTSRSWWCPQTVNTMPLETLNTYRRSGRPELRLERHIAEASDVREGLERLDVDLDAVAQQLEREGVAKFIEPFDKLQQWLENQRRARQAILNPPCLF